MQSPQELFLKYKKNPQQESLILLLQQLQPIIYAVCYKVVKNEADCQDVTQEVLVKLIREIHQLEKVEVILGWVHQIAFFTALNFKRDQIKQRTLGKLKAQVYEKDPLDDTSLALHEHIAKLDKESQQLILLRFFDNQTFNEIVAKTGKAYTTAHDDIQRALKVLKASLEKAGYFSIASELEILLETNVQVPVLKFLLNETLSQEIKKALAKKVISGMGLTIILPIVATILIVISLIATTKFFRPSEERSYSPQSAVDKKVTEKSVKTLKASEKPIDFKSKDPIAATATSEKKKSTETLGAELLTPVEKITQTSEKIAEKDLEVKENAVINEFYFENEIGETLFGGKHIFLQQGNIEVTNGLSAVISKDENGKWLMQIISDVYYPNRKNNNIINIENKMYLKFEVLEQSNKIVLSSRAIVKASLIIKNGVGSIPEGTKCKLTGRSTEITNNSYEGIVKSSVALFYFEKAGLFTLDKIWGDSFLGNINQSINLRLGETNTIVVEIELCKEQIFRITDSASRPLENYYILSNELDYFIRNFADSQVDLAVLEKTFASTGKLTVGGRVAITDKYGQVKLNRFPSGFDNFYCFVFGKNHGMQIFAVSKVEENQIIELQMKNLTSLVLKANLNNEMYQQEVNFTFFELKKNLSILDSLTLSSFISKSKIISGQLELNNLITTEYQVSINQKGFKEEQFVLDLSKPNQREHTINLLPLDSTEHYIHGYVRDKKGNPQKDISIGYDFVYATTDKEGYYKIKNLENQVGYHLKIHSHPKPADFPEVIYPSYSEFNIILEDTAYLTGEVIGLDNKPVESFLLTISVSPSKYGTSFTQCQKYFKNKLLEYGVYDITIEVPDMPLIHKVIPILKAEDNVPFTFQVMSGFSASGIVIDTLGKPVEEVVIYRFLDLNQNIHSLSSRVSATNKDGYFKIDNCLVGETYCLKKEGFAPKPIKINEENKNELLKISITNPIFKIKGTLLNSDKKPQVNVSFKVDYKLEIGGSYINYKNWKTNEDGTFLIDSLFPGEWNICFYNKDGTQSFCQKVTIIDKDEELNVMYDAKN